MFQTKFSTHFCGFPGIRIQKRGLQAPLKNCQQATTTSSPLLPGIKRQGEELLSTRAWDRNPLGSGTSSTLESRGHWLAGGQARTRQREEAGNPAGEAWWLQTRAMPGAGWGGRFAWPQHITAGVHGKRRQGQLSLFGFSERFHGPQTEAKATDV